MIWRSLNFLNMAAFFSDLRTQQKCSRHHHLIFILIKLLHSCPRTLLSCPTLSNEDIGRICRPLFFTFYRVGQLITGLTLRSYAPFIYTTLHNLRSKFMNLHLKSVYAHVVIGGAAWAEPRDAAKAAHALGRLVGRDRKANPVQYSSGDYIHTVGNYQALCQTGHVIDSVVSSQRFKIFCGYLYPLHR